MDRDSSVRFSAIIALGNAGGDQAIATLVQALPNQSEHINKVLIFGASGFMGGFVIDQERG